MNLHKSYINSLILKISYIWTNTNFINFFGSEIFILEMFVRD